ncbi:GntR family transcriptional regulator [Peptacetobacter hominis]|uniref:GntR family transcriptional regulator n=1 Tax=Peptacetobacter hominis TaxID=2743610 RepID=A0A544QV19_9FIRM|nr:GntR family transcriptional regulator [Peptacetobacter hominis]TQQ84510.1 GntR family transcriptional regulator [Peptacetobacter hominis]
MDNITKINMDNYKPLRDVVFESLRKAIVEGQLKPGQRMMEVQLAEQLGVSRTPVREAIRKLELEGLVIMLPRKGAYVADMSIKDIIDLLEVRAALEGLAASLAAERMDDAGIKKLKTISKELKKSVSESDLKEILKKDVEFHQCIFEASGNKRLAQMINALWEQVYRFREGYMSDYNAALSIIEEHESLIAAIENGECENAAKCAKDHIEKAEQYMIDKAESMK